MIKGRFLLLGSAFLATNAFAQEAPLYDGNWHATFKGAAGNSMGAQIVLKGLGGTWVTVSDLPIRAGKFPCVGSPFPVVVESASPSELKFRVDAAKTIQGCADMHVTAKQLDDKSMEGQFRNGTPLRLIRE